MNFKVNKLFFFMSLILYFSTYLSIDSKAESFTEENFYTILVNNNKEYKEFKRIVSKYNSKVVYEVPELYILQSAIKKRLHSSKILNMNELLGNGCTSHN